MTARRTFVESLIDSVVLGDDPGLVLQSQKYKVISGTCESLSYITVTGKAYKAGEEVRTFFDGEGELRFASLEDVLIDPTSDSRMAELVEYADSISVDSPLFDLFDSYVGSLGNLHNEVTSGYTMSTPIR